MRYLAPIAFLLTVTACNLEQEIDLSLPDYDRRYVVECYLQPGNLYTLALTRSAPYFAPLPDLTGDLLEETLVNDAEVSIRYKDQVIVLENEPFFNPQTGRAANYRAQSEVVPYDFESDFNLEIVTPDGQRITGVTRIMPPVVFDSIVVEFNADTLARLLTYFSDAPEETNYYRRMLHRNSLDSIPEQDFVTDDRFVENGIFVFGTAYDFEPGEQVINSLYHITAEYFDFLESVQRASLGNGNPFAQPSPIISNVEGESDPIGIFTGFMVYRVGRTIEKP